MLSFLRKEFKNLTAYANKKQMLYQKVFVEDQTFSDEDIVKTTF